MQNMHLQVFSLAEHHHKQMLDPWDRFLMKFPSLLRKINILCCRPVPISCFVFPALLSLSENPKFAGSGVGNVILCTQSFVQCNVISVLAMEKGGRLMRRRVVGPIKFLEWELHEPNALHWMDSCVFISIGWYKPGPQNIKKLFKLHPLHSSTLPLPPSKHTSATNL